MARFETHKFYKTKESLMRSLDESAWVESAPFATSNQAQPVDSLTLLGGGGDNTSIHFESFTASHPLGHVLQQLFGCNFKRIAQTKQNRRAGLIARNLQSRNVGTPNVCAVRKLFLRNAQSMPTCLDGCGKRLNEGKITRGMHCGNTHSLRPICTRI